MSNRSCRGAAALLAGVCLLSATARADQITLKDGDRVTGELIKKDGDTLTVKSKNFGTVTLKWADIQVIETDQPLNVVLAGDRVVKGSLRSQEGQIVVIGPASPGNVMPGDIIALRNDAEQRAYERFLNPGLLDLWAITGSLNIAGTQGNAEASTLTTPLNFVRASSTSRTTAYFNLIRSSATVAGVAARTAQAVRGGWAYNRNLGRRIFVNGFNDYEYDRFQALDLRVVLGSGLGYQLWRGETGRLDLLGGASWNREQFGPPPPAVPFTRNAAEAYWGDDFAYKFNARTTMVQSFRMFNTVSKVGGYRMNFDIGASTALLRWLSWNISLSDRYLRRPVPGRERNDFLYSTGFGFTFAR